MLYFAAENLFKRSSSKNKKQTFPSRQCLWRLFWQSPHPAFQPLSSRVSWQEMPDRSERSFVCLKSETLVCERLDRRCTTHVCKDQGVQEKRTHGSFSPGVSASKSTMSGYVWLCEHFDRVGKKRASLRHLQFIRNGKTKLMRCQLRGIWRGLFMVKLIRAGRNRR